MRIILVLFLVLTQAGCLPYLAVSAATTVTTGKSPGEHVLSVATQADCSAYKTVTSYDTHSYYCERPRDPATTYNRNNF